MYPAKVMFPGEIDSTVAELDPRAYPLRMETTKKLLAVQGFPGKGSTPQELGEFIRAQLQSWGQAVKAAGIQPD